MAGRGRGAAGGAADGRRLWRALVPLALALGIAALMLAVPREATLVARLATEGGDLAYEVRHRDGVLSVARVSGGPASGGRVHELWLLAPGAAPVSLGLLEGAELRVAYPVPPRGWRMAVSLEPGGGSPTGAPSGPVVIDTAIGG